MRDSQKVVNPMQIAVREQGNVRVVDLEGRMTLGHGDVELGDTIQQLLDDGARNILLNLEGITFMDSTGIGALTYGQDRVTDRGGALRVLKPTPKILQLLTITRLAAKLGVYDDEQVALDSFSS